MRITIARGFLRAPQFIVIAALTLFSGRYAAAANVSCAGPNTLSTIDAGTGGGCYDTDKFFSGFSVGANGGSSTDFPTKTSQIDLTATGGGFIGSNPATGINPIDLSFAPTTSSCGFGFSTCAWTENSGSSATGSFSYAAAVDTSTTTNPGYEAPPTGDHWVVSSLTVGPGTYSFSNASSSNSITITEQFCLGEAAVTVGCTGGSIIEKITDGSTPSVSYSLGGGASSLGTLTGGTFAFNSADLTTEVAINDELSTTRGSSGTITLDNVVNDFGEEAEAPEPATFVLLGSALAGLAILRRRRRAVR